MKVFAVLILLGFVCLFGYLVFWALPVNGWHREISTGEHTGYITAVEKTGIVWKTGTAYVKSDVSSSQEDRYCVMDDSVYAQLEKASKDRAKVTLKYRDVLVKGVKHCEGEPAIIYAVEIN